MLVGKTSLCMAVGILIDLPLVACEWWLRSGGERGGGSGSFVS